jgi:hypothetical protein
VANTQLSTYNLQLCTPNTRRTAARSRGKAANRKVSVALFSRDQVMKTFIVDGQGTKHALAEIIAKRFPEEVGSRLPPKRKPWMSEDSRMNIFDAVALALMPYLCRRSKTVARGGRRTNHPRRATRFSRG